jgi:hypothetical protein
MHTPLILSAQPYWVTPHVRSTDSVIYGGAEYQYLVLDERYAEKNGGPKMFVTSAPTGLLAVSENYPIEYRRAGIIHELIEHDASNPFSCRDALGPELDFVGQQNLPQDRYIEFRREYFALQVAYYAQTPPSSQGIHLMQLRHTYEHLTHAFDP